MKEDVYYVTGVGLRRVASKLRLKNAPTSLWWVADRVVLVPIYIPTVQSPQRGGVGGGSR